MDHFYETTDVDPGMEPHISNYIKNTHIKTTENKYVIIAVFAKNVTQVRYQ